jgi:hypothetical protein
MWSSRKILNTDKGLRCPVLVCPSDRQKPYYECARPARYYAQHLSKNGYEFDLGTILVCAGHRKLCEKQGIAMAVIDRRRKKVTA